MRVCRSRDSCGVESCNEVTNVALSKPDKGCSLECPQSTRPLMHCRVVVVVVRRVGRGRRRNRCHSRCRWTIRIVDRMLRHLTLAVIPVGHHHHRFVIL